MVQRNNHHKSKKPKTEQPKKSRAGMNPAYWRGDGNRGNFSYYDDPSPTEDNKEVQKYSALLKTGRILGELLSIDVEDASLPLNNCRFTSPQDKEQAESLIACLEELGAKPRLLNFQQPAFTLTGKEMKALIKQSKEHGPDIFRLSSREVREEMDSKRSATKHLEEFNDALATLHATVSASHVRAFLSHGQSPQSAVQQAHSLADDVIGPYLDAKQLLMQTENGTRSVDEYAQLPAGLDALTKEIKQATTEAKSQKQTRQIS